MKHIEDNDILPSYQLVNRASGSTLTQLLVMLHKLRDAKVLGKTGRWLASFLNSQQIQQAVAVEVLIYASCLLSSVESCIVQF